MRTLLITDLHLNSKIIGLLGAQKQCIKDIVKREKPDDVIIMGDVFMHRRPSPSELLAFKSILQYMRSLYHCKVTVLRGNHDSETKADDGVTALSVFEAPKIRVVTHTTVDHINKRIYIPHYENEQTIIDELEMAPEGYTIFGHFGYAGCLNSVGDADFSLGLRHFGNTTYLGHIHGFVQGQGRLRKADTTVTCLGTPYTTNFGEAFKDNFYAILENDDVEYKKAFSGPRHVVYSAKEVENNLDTINDLNYFTFLRIVKEEDHHSVPLDKVKVAHVDIKYAPVFNEDNLSSYKPERDLFSINEVIIEDYVKEANSTIPMNQP